jgi:hypothetical protein
MKALISAFAMLTFVAGTTLPVESLCPDNGKRADNGPRHN